MKCVEGCTCLAFRNIPNWTSGLEDHHPDKQSQGQCIQEVH